MAALAETILGKANTLEQSPAALLGEETEGFKGDSETGDSSHWLADLRSSWFGPGSADWFGLARTYSRFSRHVGFGGHVVKVRSLTGVAL